MLGDELEPAFATYSVSGDLPSLRMLQKLEESPQFISSLMHEWCVTVMIYIVRYAWWYPDVSSSFDRLKEQSLFP